MSDMRFFLDNAWRRMAGAPEVELNKKVDADKMYSRFDESFVEYMRNRIAMGYFRYEGKGKEYDYLDGAALKMKRYLETKNKEFLVDAANYCMLEFIKPSIEGTFFHATDDDNSHLNPVK